MNSKDQALILWVGPKHSGKTCALGDLAEAIRERGYTIGGFLAPSIYREKQLVGFDILELSSGRRARLAERKPKGRDVVGFAFRDEGVHLGRQVLQSAIQSPVDLVVVDEFGPLELDGRGWRGEVDLLLASNSGVLLLVVRDEVVRDIRRLYEIFAPLSVKATDPGAVTKVASVLEATGNGVRAPGASDPGYSHGHLT